MSLVEINWRPGERDLGSFSRVMAVALIIAGAAFAVKRRAWSAGDPGAWTAPGILTGAAALLALAGAIAPRILRPVYVAWMSLAFVMGTVSTNVVLVLFYFLVITPVGLAMRLGGRDALQLRRPTAGTSWIERDPVPDRRRYLRQF